MQTPPSLRVSAIPPIVHVVLAQATRRRAQGSIMDAVFEEQLGRIAREELEPRKLKLLRRELPDGCTRFIIKERDTGTVREMITFRDDGTLESDPSGESREISREPVG